MILVYESDGASRVLEGAPVAAGSGWGYDTYHVRLSRAPAAFKSVLVKVLPAGLGPEDEAKGFEDLEFLLPNGDENDDADWVYRTVQRLKDRNQDLRPEELEALIDEAVAEVRKGARSAA